MRAKFSGSLSRSQSNGRSEAGKRDVGGVTAQLVLADLVVQVIDLLLGAAVIPQDAGADDLVIFIQHDKAVHLAACADAPDQRGIEALQQRGDTVTDGVHQSAGSCSLQPGWGNAMPYSRLTILSIRPVSSISSSLTAEVPQINADVIHSGFLLLGNRIPF